VSLSLRLFSSGLDFETGGERVLDRARDVAGLEFNGFLRTALIGFFVFGLGDELDESLDSECESEELDELEDEDEEELDEDEEDVDEDEDEDVEDARFRL